MRATADARPHVARPNHDDDDDDDNDDDDEENNDKDDDDAADINDNCYCAVWRELRGR